jgi:hypothetical protein
MTVPGSLRSHLRTGIFEGEYEAHERIWLLLLLNLRALRDLRDEKNDIAKCTSYYRRITLQSSYVCDIGKQSQIRRKLHGNFYG